MSKMKRMLEEVAEREDEIVSIVEEAKTKRPALFAMVKEAPRLKTVESLLRGITDDKQIILLVTGYLGTIIKS